MKITIENAKNNLNQKFLYFYIALSGTNKEGVKTFQDIRLHSKDKQIIDNIASLADELVDIKGNLSVYNVKGVKCYSLWVDKIEKTKTPPKDYSVYTMNA